MRRIDLNADLGEGYGVWRMGEDAALLDCVSSASIACGGHAGDPDTMVETVSLARERGVVIGAHPGYADRAGFGRRVIPMETEAIARMVAAQVGALMGAAALAGAKVRYVKPHGALANLAAEDRSIADAIARAVAERHIVMHTDAVQAVGRMDVDFHALGVTTLDAGSHKMHGPPGIGILLIRKGRKIAPIFHGGGQQLGLRPGTSAVALAVGLAEALRLWESEKITRTAQWRAMGQMLIESLRQNLGDIPIHVIENGPAEPQNRLPQTWNLYFDRRMVEGELLLKRLDLAGLAASLGSACASGSTKASPALSAMGMDTRQAKSSIRLSFSALTTTDHIARAVDIIVSIVRDLTCASTTDPWPEFGH